MGEFLVRQGLLLSLCAMRALKTPGAPVRTRPGGAVLSRAGLPTQTEAAPGDVVLTLTSCWKFQGTWCLPPSQLSTVAWRRVLLPGDSRPLRETGNWRTEPGSHTPITNPSLQLLTLPGKFFFCLFLSLPWGGGWGAEQLLTDCPTQEGSRPPTGKMLRVQAKGAAGTGGSVSFHGTSSATPCNGTKINRRSAGGESVADD